jgi:hypothetical protein
MIRTEIPLSKLSKTTPSISGQKLMKKCRVLHDENQSLGRQIQEGPIQDLLIALGAEKEKNRQLKEKLR